MLTIVVQAGGQSRRMGQDKALLPFLGQPLIERVIQRISPIADQVLVTTNNPDAYGFLGLPLFPDVHPGRGALGGLYTALHVATHPYVAVVACDMPFVNPDLLVAQRERLVSGNYDAVIPRLEEGAEPFHAVYRRSTCLPLVLAAIQADLWRVDSWYPQANLYFMAPAELQNYDPQLLAFLNTNTPEDLAQAEQLARHKEHPADSS